MEYKLNSIDVDLRQKVKEITSTGIVHNKTDIKLNTDEEQGKKSKQYVLSNVNLRNSTDQINVDAFKEENDISKGSFLDVRK